MITVVGCAVITPVLLKLCFGGQPKSTAAGYALADHYYKADTTPWRRSPKSSGRTPWATCQRNGWGHSSDRAAAVTPSQAMMTPIVITVVGCAVITPVLLKLCFGGQPKSSAPPFLNPCYYGTDIDSRENLIACHHTVEEIAQRRNSWS